ncbi:hypothetical protein BH11PSE5_BH11PSE5_11060 [soil metagenome]
MKNLKMKGLAIALAAGTAFGAIVPAHAADYIVEFSGTGGNTVKLLITTASGIPSNGLAILSVSGLINGSTNVSGIGPINLSGFLTDNVLYPNADPAFTSFGVGFLSPGFTYNLWGDAPGAYSFYAFNGSAYTIQSTGTASVAAIPEPATWGMMLLGFGMLGAGVRYRRRSIKVAYA